MKKIGSIILVFVVLIGLFYGCQKSQDESKTLLGALSVDFNKISYIKIRDDKAKDIEIKNKSDFSFLKNYNYFQDFDSTRMNELFLFPDTRQMTIILLNGEITGIAILKNGDFVNKKVDGNYKVYTSKKPADFEYISNLLRKYNGFIEK